MSLYWFGRAWEALVEISKIFENYSGFPDSNLIW